MFDIKLMMKGYQGLWSLVLLLHVPLLVNEDFSRVSESPGSLSTKISPLDNIKDVMQIFLFPPPLT